MILHLETSTKVCSVAIANEGELLTLIEDNSENYTHSENLTVFIQQAIEQTGITLKDLMAVSVTSGPGSYTGLRIGVSTAKGLCYALNIPLIAVDALTSLAHQVQGNYPDKNLCPMLDARRMEVFSAVVDAELNILKPISADIIDENSYAEYEPFVAFGDGAEKLKEIWASRQGVVFDPTLSSAKGQVAVAWKKYNEQDFEDVAYFEPFYLKDFKS